MHPLKGLRFLRPASERCRRLLYTLQSPATFQLIVKHSKFIAHAKSVATKKDALEFIEEVKDMKATHNCFAYKLGTDERVSDDGEVAGTAGKQILSVLQHAQLDHVVVVVIRFYGGVKLGTGGLTRAYAGVTSSCLQQTGVVEFIPKTKITCSVLLSSLGSFYHVLNQIEGGDILREEFISDRVNLELSLPENKRLHFEKSFNALFGRTAEGNLD